MPDSQVVPQRSIEEIRKAIGNCCHLSFDPEFVLKQADEEARKQNGTEVALESNLYKAMTILELEKGILLASALPEQFRTFALEFNKNLQKEYDCRTPSEKSLAEVTGLNFVRTLVVQEKINSYLSLGSITEIGIKYLAILSKELDRAERHYLTSLQALRAFRMPPLEVNIKTQTAVVCQNQIVQSNNKND